MLLSVLCLLLVMAHTPDPRPLSPPCCSHPEVEQRLAEAGIDVVPSRCLKVDRAAAGGRSAL